MTTPESSKHFWTTLPGILTAIAALITAVVGAVSLFVKDKEPQRVASPVTSSPDRRQFVMAGMRVTCDKPTTSSFSGVRDSFPDSSPSARIVAFSFVQVFLLKDALENGETNQQYECTFDDPSYYVQVIPLAPRAVGTIQRCRSYRMMYSSALMEGKRITKEETACVEHGAWTPQRSK